MGILFLSGWGPRLVILVLSLLPAQGGLRGRRLERNFVHSRCSPAGRHRGTHQRSRHDPSRERPSRRPLQVPLSDDLKALRDRLLGRSSSGAAQPESSSDVEPPTPTAFLAPTPLRFGNYRVLRKIGPGRHGYRVRGPRRPLERTLAVKVIAKDAADDSRHPPLRARGAGRRRREPSPRLPALRDRESTRAALFIAMELLEGEPLSERLRDGALPLPEAMPISLGMLSAPSAHSTRGGSCTATSSPPTCS